MLYDSICRMKRTTIFLPESLERQLQQFARHHDRPVAEVVREALTAHLEAHRKPFQMPETFDSGRSDTVERFDELLFKNFDVHEGYRPDPEKSGSK